MAPLKITHFGMNGQAKSSIQWNLNKHTVNWTESRFFFFETEKKSS